MLNPKTSITLWYSMLKTLAQRTAAPQLAMPEIPNTGPPVPFQLNPKVTNRDIGELEPIKEMVTVIMGGGVDTRPTAASLSSLFSSLRSTVLERP